MADKTIPVGAPTDELQLNVNGVTGTLLLHDEGDGTHTPYLRQADGTLTALALIATQVANQADSAEVASPTTAEFNALLAKFKAAGLMVADA